MLATDNEQVIRQQTNTAPAPEQAVTTPQTQAVQSVPQTQAVQTVKPVQPTAAAAPAEQRSTAYDSAMKVLSQQGAAPSFTSAYDDDISRLYDQITQRGSFKYDYSTDPVYGQYREAYSTAGQQAMRDTQGQAAALTGGYGSSYGQAVGQQQYEAYLSRLNDVLPTLYGNAYNYYQAETNRLNSELAAAQGLKENEYGQFRDAVADARYKEALERDEAIQRGQLGDWTAYGKLYGDEAAKVAAILTNPQAAWAGGIADAEEIKKYTGAYPTGYTAKTAAAAGGGWGGPNPYSLDESARARLGADNWEAAKAAIQAEYPGATDRDMYYIATGGRYI